MDPPLAHTLLYINKYNCNRNAMHSCEKLFLKVYISHNNTNYQGGDEALLHKRYSLNFYITIWNDIFNSLVYFFSSVISCKIGTESNRCIIIYSQITMWLLYSIIIKYSSSFTIKISYYLHVPSVFTISGGTININW